LVSRIQAIKFLPKLGRINSRFSRFGSLLIAATIGFSLVSLSGTATQAAENNFVKITGLNISTATDSSGTFNDPHIVVLQGTFTNNTSQTISKLELNLVSTPSIKSRSQLADLISKPTASNNLISSGTSAILRNIPPGNQKNWQITFIGEEVLGVNASGVYAFGVKPRLGEASPATVVTTPWFFNADIKPTNVALVVPLTTLNNHLANGEALSQKSDFAEAQRLLNLISQKPGSKISWLQDSALNSWVSQLAAGSETDIPQRLEGAIASLKPAAFMPFGSTNLTALSLETDQRDLEDAINLTRSNASDLPIIYAPVRGVAYSNTVSQLSSRGIKTLVSNEYLRGNSQVTTDAIATSNSNPVLVYDLAASSCLDGAGENDAAFFKTMTCLKSDIGMITAESPQKSRSVILLAPTNWKISTSRISDLVADLGDQNWMQLASLDQVASAKPKQNFESSMTDYGNLLTELTIRQAKVLRTKTETLASVFVNKDLAIGFDNSRILGFSELWGSDARATKYLSRNLALIDSYLGSVSIQGSSRITTPEENSDIPITIVNESDHAVSVKIGLSSAYTSRFSATPTDLIQVGSRQRITVPVAITLIGAGVVEVRAELIASNGEPFGEAKNMQISSAAYSQFSRTLVWGAFGLLVLLALSNFVKRRKERRTVNTIVS
jgi:Family of unknown function (DUF6049)